MSIYNLLQPKVISSNVLFCLTNSPKLKYTPITVMYEKEKDKIIIFKKLKQVHVVVFLP